MNKNNQVTIQRVIRIKNCSECPHVCKFKGATPECSLNKFMRISNIEHDYSIPGWCPLEKDPRCVEDRKRNGIGRCPECGIRIEWDKLDFIGRGYCG